MAKFNFNPKDVDPNVRVSRDPIPDDQYTLKCVEAESKETSKGTGTYIAAKFEVVGGEHDGRWIFHNFNVDNPNEKAQQIGRGQLVAWATACGKPEADDTDKLLEKNFKADVRTEPAKDGYAARNSIYAFLFEPGEKKSSPAAKAPAAAPKATPGAKKANPWD